MNKYCQYLKSDIYKLQHSWFFWVHLLFPVLGAALMLLYSHLSSSSELNKLAAFTQIIAIAFPFVVSIVCQIVADQEVQAGRFQNMLTLPSRSKAIFSKLAILLLAGLFSTALSTVLFGVLFSYMTGTKLPIGFFVLIPIVLWISNVMMYGLHLILAFRFRRNFGISIGVIGSLLSALLQTGLGTGLVYYSIWTWGTFCRKCFGIPVRFAACGKYRKPDRDYFLHRCHLWYNRLNSILVFTI